MCTTLRRMAEHGNTPTRGVKIDPELWDEFGRAATAEGTDRSTLVEQWVQWHLHKRGARAPQQAPAPDND